MIQIILIIFIAVQTTFGFASTQPDRIPAVSIQFDSTQIVEPTSVHHEVNEESHEVVWTEDGYVNLRFWSDGTVFVDSEFKKFDCRNEGTAYMYVPGGWYIYYDCSTSRTYATQIPYPTQVDSLTSQMISINLEWETLDKPTFTPEGWWLHPRDDGTLTVMSPLGDVSKLNDGAMLLIGSGKLEMKIILRPTESGWTYANYP